MKLYERYPQSVTVCGKSYPIETDFRRWIEFYDLAIQQGNEEERVKKMLALYKGRLPDDLKAAIDALCEFYTAGHMKSDDDEPRRGMPNYDFEFDQDFFVSGFRENYGISLLQVDYMHWWEFLALFRGMNANTELKQRMQLRSIDTGQIKDPKERARIRHAQMAIAIPLPEMDDEAIGDAFASVF